MHNPRPFKNKLNAIFHWTGIRDIDAVPLFAFEVQTSEFEAKQLRQKMIVTFTTIIVTDLKLGRFNNDEVFQVPVFTDLSEIFKFVPQIQKH